MAQKSLGKANVSNENPESCTQDEFSYEAFKKHKERVPALVEAFKQNADAIMEHTKDVMQYFAWRANKRFDFGGLHKQLEQLPSIREKLKYIYELKTEFEQLHATTLCWLPGDCLNSDLRTKRFADYCDLEIQKLERIDALERRPQIEAQNEVEATKRNPEFTTARQVLAIHYLLKCLEVRNVDKTVIARFIEFLTGKNYDSIYKKVREPLKLKDTEVRKDLEFVKAYFMKLGLSEAVRMIDNEMA